MTRTEYTPEMIDAGLNEVFRQRAAEPAWSLVSKAMGLPPDHTGTDDIIWKYLTGHGGGTATGPRREYTPTAARLPRAGAKWLAHEVKALRNALGGEGRNRTPPVDVVYMAAVLARPADEVRAKWKELNPAGRGFGLDKHLNRTLDDD